MLRKILRSNEGAMGDSALTDKQFLPWVRKQRVRYE